MNVRKIAFFLVCLSVLGLNGCSNTVSQKEKNIVQSDSLYKEGQKYFLGDGVEQNYKKALEYFEKAANQGSVIAQNDLAGMYFKGIGTEKNEAKALHWFNEASKLNSPEAQYNLGIM